MYVPTLPSLKQFQSKIKIINASDPIKRNK